MLTIIHRIAEAPPADAFAAARFATDAAPQAPASRQIGDTVARWRTRDAEPAILDLAPYRIAAETYAPGGFFKMLCAMTAAGMALLLVVYITAAYLRGAL